MHRQPAGPCVCFVTLEGRRHWCLCANGKSPPQAYASFRIGVNGSAANSAGNVNSGLVLLRAYALGDRVLALNFRHDVNNSYIQRRNFFSMKPTNLLPRMTFAFANVPDDLFILQFLVNDFCLRCDPDTGLRPDASAPMNFPPALTARVIRRHGCCGRENKYDGCCLEHASEEAEQACEKTHMGFAGEGIDCGFFGEPRLR